MKKTPFHFNLRPKMGALHLSACSDRHEGNYDKHERCNFVGTILLPTKMSRPSANFELGSFFKKVVFNFISVKLSKIFKMINSFN
jgi:hypothetical protein